MSTESSESTAVEKDRVFTPFELKNYDGKDEKTPVFIAIKGVVYDMSNARNFYGKGGAYAIFAGRDASRNLALMDLEDDKNSNIDDLTAEQLKTLDDWVAKLSKKYPKVGVLGEKHISYSK